MVGSDSPMKQLVVGCPGRVLTISRPLPSDVVGLSWAEVDLCRDVPDAYIVSQNLGSWICFDACYSLVVSKRRH